MDNIAPIDNLESTFYNTAPRQAALSLSFKLCREDSDRWLLGHLPAIEEDLVVVGTADPREIMHQVTFSGYYAPKS
ncbi:MAG TPA: hypothetical protein VLX61_05850 [Anaerolineales bacterium]|nr:hypothetical protein [Anaerolineales bacterium]